MSFWLVDPPFYAPVVLLSRLSLSAPGVRRKQDEAPFDEVSSRDLLHWLRLDGCCISPERWRGKREAARPVRARLASFSCKRWTLGRQCRPCAIPVLCSLPLCSTLPASLNPRCLTSSSQPRVTQRTCPAACQEFPWRYAAQDSPGTPLLLNLHRRIPGSTSFRWQYLFLCCKRLPVDLSALGRTGVPWHR